MKRALHFATKLNSRNIIIINIIVIINIIIVIMGYIASTRKAGNLIRAKKFDILCTHAQKQLGKDQTLIPIRFLFVFFFFSETAASETKETE